MMHKIAIPPEGEMLLARRIICGKFDESPAYISFSSKNGLCLNGFDRERANAGYISECLLVLVDNVEIPHHLKGRQLLEYINGKGLWYDNASECHEGTSEASEKVEKPQLYIMPRISSSDLTP